MKSVSETDFLDVGYPEEGTKYPSPRRSELIVRGSDLPMNYGWIIWDRFPFESTEIKVIGYIMDKA